MLTTLRRWFESLAASRTRTELHTLSDRMLKDIGLSRHEVKSLFQR